MGRLSDIMLKNEKGFIVSLKLMIIILIIVAIIAIPIVFIIVGNSRKNAMLDIARRVDDAAYRYFIEQIDIGQDTILDLEKDMDKLELGGAKPTGGIVHIASTGNISFAIYNEYWCVIKKDSNSKYKMKEYEQGNCALPE